MSETNALNREDRGLDLEHAGRLRKALASGNHVQAVQNNPELGKVLASAHATAEAMPEGTKPEARQAAIEKASKTNLEALALGHSVPDPGVRKEPTLTIGNAEKQENKQNSEKQQSESSTDKLYTVELNNGHTQFRYEHNHRLAFTDRGNEIKVYAAKESAVQGAMQHAKEKGWQKVTLEGKRNFKDLAHFEAQRQQMSVENHIPKDQETRVSTMQATRKALMASVGQKRKAQEIEAGV